MTLPARAKYLPYDARRSKERAGIPEIETPKDFMQMTMTVVVRFNLEPTCIDPLVLTNASATSCTALHQEQF